MKKENERVCEKNCPDYLGMEILHKQQCDCSCHNNFIIENKRRIMNKEKTTELIYEAARLKAILFKRSIVPEKWQERDEKFRKQMIDVVERYLAMETLPTKDAIFLALVWLAKSF